MESEEKEENVEFLGRESFSECRLMFEVLEKNIQISGVSLPFVQNFQRNAIAIETKFEGSFIHCDRIF